MGETQLDEETFNEYIESMAEEYTAEKYHLMEFNCNHFTADVVGFLTGGTIPEWISGESERDNGMSNADGQAYRQNFWLRHSGSSSGP